MDDALKNLDISIKKWIQSDGVFETILALNKELGCWGEELSVISQLIISVSLKEVRPENVAREIAKGLPFLEDKQVEHAATVLKKKVFYPMGPAFKKYGIDIDKISTTLPAPIVIKPPAPKIPSPPVAREVKLEPPKVAPVAKPQITPPKLSNWQAMPKAREMEFAPMTDVRRPFPAPSGASQGKPLPPKAPAPAISAPANPFGLSDVAPKNPEPQELVKYQDEHPMSSSANSESKPESTNGRP